MKTETIVPKLILILAESAFETIPKSLWRHPVIQQHSRRLGKQPRRVLLDRSYHHQAMKILKENKKRGRPDIVHFALLEALGSPLNRERRLKVYVHTRGDHVITVNPEVRLPRNYSRFVGLAEQLFELKKIRPDGKTLLELSRKKISALLRELCPDRTVAFSRRGRPRKIEEAVFTLKGKERPVVIIGGFPFVNFSEAVVNLVDDVFSVDPEMIDASVVTSRVIYEYERVTGLLEKRIELCSSRIEENI